jgi:DNA-binding CsgD family transcriptional regulator
LTPRESEVLYWLMKGKTNWELGSILSITAKTAGRHLEHIFAKLNVDNRTAAVRVAFEAAGGGF